MIRHYLLPSLMLGAGLALMAASAAAGTVRNEDAREYSITVHWEDLSPPETFELPPGEERRFEDKRATVELVGRKDNIYMQPEDVVVVQDGVMRLKSLEEGENQ